MRDKPKSLLVVIVGLVVAITGSAGLVLATRQASAPPTSKGIALHAPAGQQSAFRYLQYQGVDGQTALDLLKTHAQVVTKESAYGTYVDAINGVTGGSGGKYWMLYVNGKQSAVGAAAYVSKTGDRIEWKFE